MKKILKILFWSCIAIVIVCTVFASAITLEGKKMYQEAIQKISIQDKIAEIRSKENYLSIEEIPLDYRNAVVAVEDHRFQAHKGIDIISTTRAVLTNIFSLSIQEGGSTITQQLAKNIYFTQEQELTRKVAELFVAFDFEKEFSKDDILELYINTSYYGNGYYGLKEASLGYLEKEIKDLTLDEMTLLAGIPNAPSVYALTANPDLARQRQKQVLYAMLEYGYLDTQTVNALLEVEN